MLAEQAGDVQARSSVGTARKSRGKARHEEDLRAAPSSRTPAGPPHGTVKNVVEVAPSQGQQQTSDRGHRAGTGSPRKPTAALPTQSGREGRRPRGGTGHRGKVVFWAVSGPQVEGAEIVRAAFTGRGRAEPEVGGRKRRDRDRFRVHARPPSQHPGSQERSRTGSAKTFLAERKCRRQVRDVEPGRCRQQ